MIDHIDKIWGSEDRIRQEAFKIYQHNSRRGIIRTPEKDWTEAIETLKIQDMIHRGECGS